MFKIPTFDCQFFASINLYFLLKGQGHLEKKSSGGQVQGIISIKPFNYNMHVRTTGETKVKQNNIILRNSNAL